LFGEKMGIFPAQTTPFGMGLIMAWHIEGFVQEDGAPFFPRKRNS